MGQGYPSDPNAAGKEGRKRKKGRKKKKEARERKDCLLLVPRVHLYSFLNEQSQRKKQKSFI